MTTGLEELLAEDEGNVHIEQIHQLITMAGLGEVNYRWKATKPTTGLLDLPQGP